MRKWLPPIIALIVFVVLLVFFFSAVAASRPEQVQVLAAARALQPGDVLSAADLQVVSVYKDPRSEAYIPAERQADVIGGVVLQPFEAGDPLTKLGVASVGTSDTRLMGLLADFPGMAIFPLPLDLRNVVAPEIDHFHAGDIVSLTVVYPDRPSIPENPAISPLYTGFLGEAPTPIPVEITPTPTASWLDFTERGKPPVAKTFENAYRVVAVYGQTETPAVIGSGEDTTSPYTAGITPPRPILMLLVPQSDIEPLSLAVTQGQVFVSLVLEVHPPLGGYSYWDFEQMLKEERERLQLQAEAKSATATPTPTPTPKP